MNKYDVVVIHRVPDKVTVIASDKANAEIVAIGACGHWFPNDRPMIESVELNTPYPGTGNTNLYCVRFTTVQEHCFTVRARGEGEIKELVDGLKFTGDAAVGAPRLGGGIEITTPVQLEHDERAQIRYSRVPTVVPSNGDQAVNQL